METNRIFIAGILLGAFIFDLGYPLYSDFLVSGNKGAVTMYESLGISRELMILFFVIFAIVAFYITAFIQKKVSKKVHKY